MKMLLTSIFIVFLSGHITTYVNGCRDSRKECAYWASKNYCYSNAAYMNTWCKRSCNKCYSATSTYNTYTVCNDLNRYCRSWTQTGECSRNPAYMRTNCAKSCGFCQTRPTKTKPHKKGKKKPKHDHCKNKNKDKDCDYWYRNDYCRTNRPYMEKNCQKSCGWCKDSPKDVWGSWGRWGSCSKKCGQGTQSRTRRCEKGKCKGDTRETKTCQIKPCQSTWGSWGNWLPCTKSCGQGTTTRVRKCPDSTCPGSSKESKPCYKRDCVSNWGNWGSWSGCTGSCDYGTRTRQRKCPGYTCAGDSKESETCFLTPCQSNWGNWGRWSPCTATCGRGSQLRVRSCPDNTCRGDSRESKECSLKDCPTGNINSCGKQGHTPLPGIGRVVGGTDASPGEWPWQVGLVVGENRKPAANQLPICGGTLIKPNIVLTAAHCFMVRKDPNEFWVRVGDHSMDTQGKYEKLIRVKEIIEHKGFNRITFTDDIALLVLEESVTLSKEVNTACLPENNDTPVDCTVTGWGRTQEGGQQSDILQKAPLPVVENSVCDETYKEVLQRDKVITQNMLCFGQKDGRVDACQGDSGGPLVCRDDKTLRFVIRGVVSWGVGCARKERYGVYTNVYKYSGWIEDAIMNS